MIYDFSAESLQAIQHFPAFGGGVINPIEFDGIVSKQDWPALIFEWQQFFLTAICYNYIIFNNVDTYTLQQFLPSLTLNTCVKTIGFRHMPLGTFMDLEAQQNVITGHKICFSLLPPFVGLAPNFTCLVSPEAMPFPASPPRGAFLLGLGAPAAQSTPRGSPRSSPPLQDMPSLDAPEVTNYCVPIHQPRLVSTVSPILATAGHTPPPRRREVSPTLAMEALSLGGPAAVESPGRKIVKDANLKFSRLSCYGAKNVVLKVFIVPEDKEKKVLFLYRDGILINIRSTKQEPVLGPDSVMLGDDEPPMLYDEVIFRKP